MLADNGNGPDSDPDGDPIFVQDRAGFVTDKGNTYGIQTNGDFIFFPVAGFTGTDSFDYELLDGQAADTGTVTIIVPEKENRPPIAQDDVVTFVEGADPTGNVLADNGNGPDSDPDGDPIFVQDRAGFVTDKGNTYGIETNGDFIFFPVAGFTGTDSFDYELLDGQAADTGTVTIIVPEKGNSPPIAQDDVITFVEGRDPTGNVLDDNGNGPDSDPDGDPIFVQDRSFLETEKGNRYSIESDGQFIFFPEAGFTGTDSFEYELLDGQAADTGTVTIIVPEKENRPPIAQDDVVTFVEGADPTGNLLDDNGNGPDSDPDGDPIFVQDRTNESTDQGNIFGIASNGDFIFFPKPGFTGTDTFDYTLLDDQGGADTGTVTITVEPDDEPGGPLFETPFPEVAEKRAIDPANINGVPADALKVEAGQSVRVAFVDEVAAVDSSLGYVVIKEDGSFAETGVVFENTDGPDRGYGKLVPGDAVDIGPLHDGELAFFFVRGGAGFIEQDSVLEFRGAGGNPANVNDGMGPDLFVDGKAAPAYRPIYFTHNPGGDPLVNLLNDGKGGNVISGQGTDGSSLIAFEGLPGGSPWADHDFNDLIFSVTFTDALL